MPTFLTVTEVAKIVKRKPRTIQRWAREGVFPAARKVKQRDWIIPEVDLNRFLLNCPSPLNSAR